MTLGIGLSGSSLNAKARGIIKRYSGSLWLPSDTTCWQENTGTTPSTKDSPVGYLMDLIGTNHATQATSGSRPMLRRGAKNLFLNSATLSTQGVTVQALTYTVQFIGTGTITFSGAYSGSLVGTGAADQVTKTFTCTAGTLTCTVSGSVNNAQCELGSVANTQVNTTTVPLSNGVGQWWLDFDGVDDFLATASVPFAMATDHFVACAAMITNPAVTSALMLSANTASANPAAYMLRVGASLDAYAYYRDDAGLDVTIQCDNPSAATPFVMDLAKSGTSVTAAMNSVEGTPTSVATLGTTTLNNMAIGAWNRSAPTNYMAGRWYGSIALQGAPTSAQKILMRRYLAAISGVQL